MLITFIGYDDPVSALLNVLNDITGCDHTDPYVYLDAEVILSVDDHEDGTITFGIVDGLFE